MIPTYLLTENGPSFLAKFFEAVTGCLGVKHLTTTAYPLKINRQVKRLNRKIVARLQHYVADRQTNLDQYVQLLTYAHNAQAHKSTGTMPFTLELSRQLPSPTTLHASNANPVDKTELPETISFRNRLLRQLEVFCKHTVAKIKMNQALEKRHFERIVRHTPQFNLGQHVFVDRPPVETTEQARMVNAPLTKLLPKFIRPFRVVSVTPVRVTVNENGIQSTVFVDGVSLAPGHAKRNKVMNQNNYQPDANYYMNKDKKDEIGAQVSG